MNNCKEGPFAMNNLAFQASHSDLANDENSTGDKMVSGATVQNIPEVLEKRATWGHGLEFLMSCIAMSVGLGNIWRFPFTAYENGGGAFLIPYTIVLVLVGRPLYYMEMALGQFSSKGSVHMFESLAPALKGVGYGQLLGCICVATYYCSLMAITLFYLLNSFTVNLPWADCKPKWNLEINATCIPALHKGNRSLFGNSMSSSELWFTKEVLREKSTIDDGIGLPEWKLTLCLLASWICTFAVSRRGVQSSGKAAYFLAVFPYIVMFGLLMRALTLEGSMDGILFFIRPQWDKLLTPQIWYAAVTQCFFSLNVGFGAIVMFSSYNSFDHNINRDALVVTTLDTFTSTLAGATIFGILGNLAHEMETDIEKVVRSGGSGLAFVSYPEAIAKFETVPWLFAILFFVMLFVLSLGSLAGLHGCVITVIKDAFPDAKNWHISLSTAVLGFLFGLVYVTPGGQFILTLVDHFGGTVVIFFLCNIEVIAIVWCYGLDNFCLDVEFMVKEKVGLYWRLTWGLITPVLLLGIFVYFIMTLERLQYAGHDYPNLVLGFGWSILVLALLQLLFWMFHALYEQKTEKKRKAFGCQDWGPSNPLVREEYKKFKEQKQSQTKHLNKLQKILYALIGK